jgi:carbonic anhydrase
MHRHFSRRSVLSSLAAGVASVCPVGTAFAAADGNATKAGAGAAKHPPHWGYEGDAGPERWGDLRPDFRVCALGMEQTPIDLKGGVRAEIGSVEPSFREMPLVVLNNGHTIQVNCPPGSHTVVAGVRYDLLQFHFHHPSEHLLSGKRFDLELHFVHRSEKGELAVLGVFIRPGAASGALAPIWAAMPPKVGPAREAGAAIRPAALLPVSRGCYRYAGSLTTPPCSEGVLWTVFKEPIEASPDQIRQFAQLFPVNARPVQGLHRRFLLEAR